MSLLEIRNLGVIYHSRMGIVRAVNSVSFSIEKGQSLGLVGESGCGKTTLVLSILRLLPPAAEIVSGQIFFEDQELLSASETEMREIRGKGISMIFQASMSALNPLHTAGDQIAEAIQAHNKVEKADAFSKACDALRMVHINPSKARDYPHEFSGGMRQRIMIAMALACNPKILLADEPHTALDVMTSAQILELIRNIRKRSNLAMLMVTHDLSVVAETCEKTAVMYASNIVEIADTKNIFHSPLHPYTMKLISCFPRLSHKTPFETLKGTPPDLITPPPGCKFHPRCNFSCDLCRKEEPQLVEIEPNHFAACHFIGDVEKR